MFNTRWLYCLFFSFSLSSHALGIFEFLYLPATGLNTLILKNAFLPETQKPLAAMSSRSCWLLPHLVFRPLLDEDGAPRLHLYTLLPTSLQSNHGWCCARLLRIHLFYRIVNAPGRVWIHMRIHLGGESTDDHTGS